MNTGTLRLRGLARTASVCGAPIAGILLTSCSAVAPLVDQPVASTSPTSAPSSPTSAPTSASLNSGSLADVDPCALVPDAVRTQFVLTDPQATNLDGAPACQFHHEGSSSDSTYTVSVELVSEEGVDDIWSPDVEELPVIGTHQAMRFSGPKASCRVALAVTESSRVDVAAVGGHWWPGCELAIALATAIEPDVP